MELLRPNYTSEAFVLIEANLLHLPIKRFHLEKANTGLVKCVQEQQNCKKEKGRQTVKEKGRGMSERT